MAHTRIAVLAAASAFLGCGGSSGNAHGPPDEPGYESATYVESHGEVPNPDRGLLQVVDVFDEGDIEFVRDLGVTLGSARIHLDEFRDAPISDAFLNDLAAGLADVRAAGLSLVVRFQYNNGSGNDAPLALMLQHIEQVGPILRDNADVISVVQAGFIGAWGEWHSSSNGLDNPEDRATVLLALLDELPPALMVQVRTPFYKDAIAPGGPLDAARAYSDEVIARVGHHNDCFLSSDSDNGTYDDPIEEWKAYAAADGRFVPVGGESCNANPPRTECATALRELRELHWSYANRSYHPDVIGRWKQQGCFDDIERDLGYRLVLRWARWTESMVPGEPFELEFCVQNVGYAAPFKPRPVYAVFGDGDDRVEVELPDVDPRTWQSGETIVVSTTAALPATLGAGPQRLSLWLPSQSDRVRDRAEYAVRFANEDVWDASEAVNVLSDAVDVGGN